MQPIITFFKRKPLYLGIVRYLLGITMIPYGLTKIMRTQFVVYPHAWLKPLESISGMNLAWAFLGHSAWFEVLLGCFELVPAVLLLFRRTTLLGAILMLPLTLNVLLINYAFNLWDGTKTMAVLLFVLNCLIFIFEWRRIINIAQLVVNKGFRINYLPAEMIINTALVLIVGYFAITPLLDYSEKANGLTGDYFNGRPSEWILQHESSNDSVLPHRQLKVYFGPNGDYQEVGINNFGAPTAYTVNFNKHTVTLKYEQGWAPLIYHYHFLGDTALKLEAVVGNKGTKLTQLYRKRIIHSNIDGDSD
jgi:hypothetical protein